MENAPSGTDAAVNAAVSSGELCKESADDAGILTAVGVAHGWEIHFRDRDDLGDEGREIFAEAIVAMAKGDVELTAYFNGGIRHWEAEYRRRGHHDSERAARAHVLGATAGNLALPDGLACEAQRALHASRDFLLGSSLRVVVGDLMLPDGALKYR